MRIAVWIIAVGLTTWFFPHIAKGGRFDLVEMIVYTAWAATITGEGIRYVLHRIEAGRRSGKSIEEIAADGTTPMTKNVWLDAAIFGGLFLFGFAAIIYFALFSA